MYDLVKIKKLNKNKIIIVVIITILLVVLATIVGSWLANFKIKQKYNKEIEQQERLEEQERQWQIEKQKAEEEAKQAEIQKHIEQTSGPLNEDQKDNILHIYRTTGIKRVFLTFDDGPTQIVTPLILDVLKQENIKATFFVLGNNAKNNSDLIKREFEEGHYIANHGYSHKYGSIYSSPEATLEEYNTTEQIIRDALGNQSYCSRVFRFPGGSNGGYYNTTKQKSKELLKENGIVHLDWNSLSKDAEGAYSKEQLLQNAIDTIGEKDSVVILMHDISDKILTYEMLPDLILYLKQQGYEFQNIYDLL